MGIGGATGSFETSLYSEFVTQRAGSRAIPAISADCDIVDNAATDYSLDVE
jgi:hypothetical protein